MKVVLEKNLFRRLNTYSQDVLLIQSICRVLFIAFRSCFFFIQLSSCYLLFKLDRPLAISSFPFFGHYPLALLPNLIALLCQQRYKRPRSRQGALEEVGF